MPKSTRFEIIGVNTLQKKDEINITIGQNIQRIRKAKGLNQKELSEKIGTGISTLSNYETGTRSFPISLLSKLAQELDVPLNFIINGIPVGVSDKDIKRLNSQELQQREKAALADLAKFKLSLSTISTLLRDLFLRNRFMDDETADQSVTLDEYFDELLSDPEFDIDDLDDIYYLLSTLSLVLPNLYADFRLKDSASYTAFTEKVNDLISKYGYFD